MTPLSHKQKLYCYVDETGQDTMGEFFLVSVVITATEREMLVKQLEEIERVTGKGRRKWLQTRRSQRSLYITRILSLPLLRGKLHYAVYHDTTDYLARTVLATARAITVSAEGDYKATVLVDGLPKSQTRWFGKELRQLRIRTEKVRGVRKGEADALMRLADGLCGFVRAALTGQEESITVLEKAKALGYLREV
jgi:hypothetical protein